MNHKHSRLEKRFHRIARQLTRFDLQKVGRSEEKAISENDIVADLEKHSGSSLFMGFYTRSGLIEAFQRYGITKILEDKGFSNLLLHVETDDPFHHVAQLYGGDKRDPERLLLEMVLHEAVVTSKLDHVKGIYDVIFVEWLCLQNPMAEFEKRGPRLPGQEKPGLGILAEIVELLIIMTERLGKDGLINVPRYYHTAHKGHDMGFQFFDPPTEGIFQALKGACSERPLAEATWAVELGLVRQTDGSGPYIWPGEEQVLAISEKAKRHFASREYAQLSTNAKASTKFEVDWETLQMPS